MIDIYNDYRYLKTPPLVLYKSVLRDNIPLPVYWELNIIDRVTYFSAKVNRRIETMIDNNYRELLELVNQELEDMTLEDLKNFYFDRRIDELAEQYYQFNRAIQTRTFEKDSKE